MEGAEVESGIEVQVFKSLSHQIRRDIIRFVGEKGRVTFTEVKNALKISDSSSLSYHLSGLAPLLAQEDSFYLLNDLGKHAYRLILGTTSVGSESRLRRGLRYAIVANALLWAAANVAIYEFEGTPHFMTLASLAVLWFSGNLILARLSE